jgi:MFS family permease
VRVAPELAVKEFEEGAESTASVTSLRNRRNVALLLCWLGMFSTGFAATTPLSMLVPIERAFGLTASQVSIWFNIQVFGMALLALPVGWAIDKYGPTRVSYVAVVLLGVGGLSWAMGMVSTFLSLWLSTLTIAVGAILYSIVVPKVVSLWVTNRHLGKGHGSYMSARSLGAALGVGLISLAFVENWRGALKAPGLLLCVAAVAWAVFVRKSPMERNLQSAGRSTAVSWATLASILRSQTTWLLAGILFVVMSANVSWLTFGYSYLTKDRAKALSGMIMMIGILGTSAGAAITPSLSDHFKRRRPFFLLAALVLCFTFVCIGLLRVVSVPALFVCSGMIGLGVGSLAPLIFVVASEAPELGRRVMGMTVAILLLIGNTPGLIVPAVGGRFLVTLGGATATRYQVIWQCLALLVLVIGVLGFRLRETGGLTTDH